MRVSILPPEVAAIDDDELNTAISPDARWIAFVATDTSGSSQLWVRDLAMADARPLPGTQQGTLPFWSPDSRSIGFFADGKLKRVDREGRNVQIIADAPDGRGGAWSRRGVIVFAASSRGGLSRVGETGGPVEPATTLDRSRGEQAHRFPSFLPDGTHFLYADLCRSDTLPTRLAALGDMRTHLVLVTLAGGAVFAGPGHVLFARDGVLMVQRFDAWRGRLAGEPEAIGTAPTHSVYAGAPPASASANGVIAQRAPLPSLRDLVWLGRDGRRLATVPLAPDRFQDLRLAPDDDHVALTRQSSGTTGEICAVELTRGISTRLTFGEDQVEQPIWSGDGRQVIFSSFHGAIRDLSRVPASGAGGVEVVLHGHTPFTDPACMSSDGRYLIFRDLDPATGEDVWADDLAGGHRVFPVLRTPSHEMDPSLSPDGRWLAYRSNESGRAELYVQSFPSLDAKYRVSGEGASAQARSRTGRAFWRRDGRELVYVSGDGATVMSVPLETSGGLHVGVPRPLFRTPGTCAELAATSNLDRFLMLEDLSTKASGAIHLLVDWPAELTRR